MRTVQMLCDLMLFSNVKMLREYSPSSSSAPRASNHKIVATAQFAA